MTGNVSGLDVWKSTLDYLDTMQKTVQSWENFFEEEFSSDWFAKQEMTDLTRRLWNTFEVLRCLYVYNHTDTLAIDPRASGFPEGHHIRALSQVDSMTDSATEQALRRMALDELFKKRQMNYWMLEKIARAKAQQLLHTNPVMTPFTVRSWDVTKKSKRTTVHRICFERYCSRNIPSLYLMLIESDSDVSADLKAELTHVLLEETKVFPRLGGLALSIDRAIAPIRPVWVGRVSLGPLFIPNLTKDEHLLQAALNAEPDASSVGSRIIYEYVLAKGHVPAQKLFDASGRKHNSIQEFEVRQLDRECAKREVSFVSKYLFAPHRVAQALDAEFRQQIGHRLITTE